VPLERIQKILAAAGYGSRRGCEELIAAGRVKVNGQVAILGAKADSARDKITLDGEPVRAEQTIYVAVHKPRGIVSSLEPQGDRRTVRDLVTVPERLYPVGRLDMQSEGLILLTNDGELTNRITHPRYGHEKEYRVLVTGRVDGSVIDTWRRGVVIVDEDGQSERTRPAQVAIESHDKGGGESWLTVVMREGKKHQIRRVAETLGLRVRRIIRVRMGPLHLGRLKPGEWRHLSWEEVRSLKAASGIRRSKAGPAAGRRKPPGSSPAGTKRKPAPSRQRSPREARRRD
jgi:23S rRNA pseudouridine2605 synthase